jgi:hypothetical protein
MLAVRELGREDYAVRNQLVADSPQGNVFLHADWLQMLGDTDPDLRSLILGCFDDEGRLVGGQAVTYHQRWGMDISATFEFFYSGPMVAPVAGNQAGGVTRAAAIVSALAEALAERLAYVEFETHPAFGDVRPFLYAGWQVVPTYTHIWPMDDVDRAWRAMSQGKRRRIERARKQFTFGVEEGDAVLDEYLPLHHQTVRKFYWQPSPTWEAIFRRRFHWMRERDGCRLYTARTGTGELAGGELVLLSREDETAYIWQQAFDREYLAQGISPALDWYAASDLATEFPQVNFGSSPYPSLAQFKDEMGAEPVVHFTVRKNNARFRWAIYQRALKLKDRVYNLAMSWKRLLHQRSRS